MKYPNITISGLVCTGTTTLSKLLSEKLGWERHSTGELFRKYCLEHNLPLEETSLRPDSITLEIDSLVKEKLQQEKNLIMEGWLTGFLARDLKDVFKILLVCNDALRIDRLVNRDNLTVEEAKEEIEVRERENLKKWTRIYGVSDFWEPKYYDLTIDTYENSKEEALNKTLAALSTAGEA
ncbi:cytidylate kinase family protein [Candidatus Gottesmanbacteria bacterium]|nr:cytidylate kinase family protein [Candidatus Gottesmanbacteria bacterium]